MTASLNRVIVSVASLERALEFYEGVLGLTQKVAPPGFAMLALGTGPSGPAAPVELLLHERATHPSMAGVAMSLRVEDVDQMTEAAEELGCTVIDKPTDQPWGERLAVLTDPDGHVVCLASALS